MTRKIYDVRIYPGAESGFDIILRIRGGIMKQGTFATLHDALAAARAVEGRKPNAPIYLYDRSFPEMMADALAPAIEAIRKGGAA